MASAAEMRQRAREVRKEALISFIGCVHQKIQEKADLGQTELTVVSTKGKLSSPCSVDLFRIEVYSVKLLGQKQDHHSLKWIDPSQDKEFSDHFELLGYTVRKREHVSSGSDHVPSHEDLIIQW